MYATKCEIKVYIYDECVLIFENVWEKESEHE